MLTDVFFANRCVTPGSIGIKMRANPQVIYVPTGLDNFNVTGDIEYFLNGNNKHAITDLIDGKRGDVVIVREAGKTLEINIASPGAKLKVLQAAEGVPDLANTPQNSPVGQPDDRLSINELAERYMARLYVMVGNKFDRSANNLFFAATGGDTDKSPPDKFDSLVTAMSGLNSDPKKEADAGVPPAVSRVQVVPGYSEADLPDQLSRLDKASAAIALYQNVFSIAARTKRGHPDPYDISIPAEASQLNADLADSAVNSLTGPLSGYFTASNSTSNKLDKEMMSTEIHLEFLNSVFSDFSFSEADKKGLDSILTNVASTLSGLKVSSASSDSTMNHMIQNGTVQEIVLVQDDGKDKVIGYIPIVRVTYLHVAQDSWSVSVGKSSAEKVHFEMDYSDTTFKLNISTFDTFVAKLDAIIQQLIGMNAADFGKKLNQGSATGTLPK